MIVWDPNNVIDIGERFDLWRLSVREVLLYMKLMWWYAVVTPYTQRLVVAYPEVIMVTSNRVF